MQFTIFQWIPLGHMWILVMHIENPRWMKLRIRKTTTNISRLNKVEKFVHWNTKTVDKNRFLNKQSSECPFYLQIFHKCVLDLETQFKNAWWQKCAYLWCSEKKWGAVETAVIAAGSCWCWSLYPFYNDFLKSSQTDEHPNPSSFCTWSHISYVRHKVVMWTKLTSGIFQ